MKSTQKNTPKIIFITGVSGSGKSTLVPLLKEQLPLYNVHDFDEVGVPDDVDLSWRLETTDFWLKKSKDNLVNNTSTIICGTSVPEEILNSSEYDSSLIVLFGFIEISEATIQERLSSRGWTQSLIDSHKNWSNILAEKVRKTRNHRIFNGNKSQSEIINEIKSWIEGFDRINSIP